MEKNNVNRINESNKKLTKDGIHIIIGLSLDKKYQIYIRNEIIPEIKNMV